MTAVEIDIAPPRYPEEWIPATILSVGGYEHYRHFAFARHVIADIFGQRKSWDRLDCDRIRVTP